MLRHHWSRVRVIRNTIPIGIRIRGIGAEDDFLGVGQAVAVDVRVVAIRDAVMVEVAQHHHGQQVGPAQIRDIARHHLHGGGAGLDVLQIQEADQRGGISADGENRVAGLPPAQDLPAGRFSGGSIDLKFPHVRVNVRGGDGKIRCDTLNRFHQGRHHQLRRAVTTERAGINAVRQTISVRVGIERVGACDKFSGISQSIGIRVHPGRVGAAHAFVAVGQAIVVEIIRIKIGDEWVHAAIRLEAVGPEIAVVIAVAGAQVERDRSERVGRLAGLARGEIERGDERVRRQAQRGNGAGRVRGHRHVHRRIRAESEAEGIRAQTRLEFHGSSHGLSRHDGRAIRRLDREEVRRGEGERESFGRHGCAIGVHERVPGHVGDAGAQEIRIGHARLERQNARANEHKPWSRSGSHGVGRWNSAGEHKEIGRHRIRGESFGELEARRVQPQRLRRGTVGGSDAHQPWRVAVRQTKDPADGVAVARRVPGAHGRDQRRAVGQGGIQRERKGDGHRLIRVHNGVRRLGHRECAAQRHVEGNVRAVVGRGERQRERLGGIQ